MNHGIALAHGIAGHLGQLFYLDVPLQGQARLNGFTRALGVAHGVNVGELATHDPSLLFQSQADLLARLVAFHAIELSARVGDVPGLVHDLRHGQIVALAQLEVVRIVRRGDLHRTGSEFWVHVVIGHHDHVTVIQEWMRQRGTHQI